MKKIIEYLSAPNFDDDDINLSAHMLHGMLTAVFSVTLFITLPISFFFSAQQDVAIVLQAVGVLVICVFIFFILKSGQVYVACWSLLALFWVLNSAGVWFTGGIHSTSFANNIAVIFTAGLLLGANAGFVFAVLSGVFGFILVFAEKNGLYVFHPVEQSLYSLWFSNIGVFIVVALLQGYAANTTRNALKRAKESEKLAKNELEERKISEEKREKLIIELEAKNAELEQFTYTVSHDLKAPLITIKGFLGLLTKDANVGASDKVEKDISRISDAANRMQELLNDLLELSRVGRLMNPPEQVPCSRLVNEAREILDAQIREKNIQLKISQHLPILYGDAQRLLAVIQNLFDNAIKFMGSQPQPQIEFGQLETPQAGFALLYVRDNGIGIAPEFYERIFGLFNRLNPDVDGTGIGLTITKRIIEFYGGKIWLESEEGQGCTFYFTLPVFK